LAALEKRGVTSLTGEEGARVVRSLQAKALYWPSEGGPGTLIFGPSPTRAQVTEELMHLGQFRNRGWPTTNNNPLLRVEIEIEAQDRLLQLGARRGWTEAELNEIRQAREVWLAEQRRLLESQR
jgi:hypothetical protein